MHVVFVSHEYADPSRRGKLRALAGLGHRITAAVPAPASGVDGPISLAGIPVRGSAAAPDSQKWSGRALAALFRDLRPELIQIEAEPHSLAAAAAASAAVRAGIPYLAFSWASLVERHTLLARRRRRAVLGRAAGVIGGNRLAEGGLRAEAPAARHAVIPQFGIVVPPAPATSIQRPGMAQELAIGYLGRLVPERGVDQLLRACNQVMGSWTLTILGTGPAQEPLEVLAQRLGQASRLRWLGGAGREAIERLWAEIDVVVVPSRATPEWVERFHPNLLDAMARGIPGVVTDTGALPELVGDAGWIAADAEGIALGLQHLLADPDRRRRLGLAARERVIRHFSDAAIAERTAAFWRDVPRDAATVPAAD